MREKTATAGGTPISVIKAGLWFLPVYSPKSGSDFAGISGSSYPGPEGKGRGTDLPIDGMVLIFDDLAYSASCGRTGHHYKDGLAFKFEDETYETVLKSIE